jgi:hypothetical protein
VKARPELTAQGAQAIRKLLTVQLRGLRARLLTG